MARMIAMTSIDAKIDKIRKGLVEAKEQYDRLAEELRSLQKKRDELVEKNILAAFRKSRKSYEEVMTFLGK
ncbi:MAG: hypothetical protein IK089_07075 [Oxalobacter sp.]|nr:hypothetical protein [Oxalobacter sp.]